VHRSTLDVSGAEYARKEVPLQVITGHPVAKFDFPLSSFVDLQHLLFTEEQTAYNQAMSQSAMNGKVHPLAAIHHSSTYQASMCKLKEHCHRGITWKKGFTDNLLQVKQNQGLVARHM